MLLVSHSSTLSTESEQECREQGAVEQGQVENAETAETTEIAEIIIFAQNEIKRD